MKFICMRVYIHIHPHMLNRSILILLIGQKLWNKITIAIIFFPEYNFYYKYDFILKYVDEL